MHIGFTHNNLSPLLLFIFVNFRRLFAGFFTFRIVCRRLALYKSGQPVDEHLGGNHPGGYQVVPLFDFRETERLHQSTYHRYQKYNKVEYPVIGNVLKDYGIHSLIIPYFLRSLLEGGTEKQMLLNDVLQTRLILQSPVGLLSKLFVTLLVYIPFNKKMNT